MSILSVELATDPEVRGYSSMTDLEVTVDLNTEYETVNKSSMSSSEVFQAIDSADLLGLTADDSALVWNILHLGQLDPFGLEATLFISVFGEVSNTITNLSALRKTNVTRAQKLKIPKVRVGHVTEARL